MRRGISRGRLLRSVPFAAILVGAGLLGAIGESRSDGDVNWMRRYDTARSMAEQSHKPMLVCFHSAGVGWCSKLDAETFPDQRVAELAHRCVCVRLECGLDTSAERRFSVHSYPTTIITDEHGNARSRFTGFVMPERLAASLASALASRAAGR